jgi:hypothetical protein
MKNYRLVILAILITFTSCLEEVQIPTRLESAVLVVDGGITNAEPPYTVRLSYSGNQINATDINLNLAIVGATVFIKDDLGDSTELIPSYYERGVYRSEDPNFIGKIGRSYAIKIILKGGKTFVSKPEKMPYCPPIDSLYEVYTDIRNESMPDGYQIFLNTGDPANAQNYYRWTAYAYSRVGRVCENTFCLNNCGNFCWVPRYQTSINILSDANINGNPIRRLSVFFSPVYAVGKHFIEVSQFSFTREAYQFWKLYQEQSTRTGTIFDPLPAPILGNVYNAQDPNDYALGYFGVSGISTKRLVVYGRYDESAIFLNAGRFTPSAGGCSLPFATCDRPIGWPKE